MRNLTIVMLGLIVRAMEEDVSENPMRAIDVERLVFERPCW